jgi:predicted HAD superfamily Cof-like phosphohydrolase
MNLVNEFHETFGHAPYDTQHYQIFDTINITNINFRYDLIHEEVCEYIEADANNDLIEKIDALCDIMYVCYGALITFGMNENDCIYDECMSEYIIDPHGDVCLLQYYDTEIKNAITNNNALAFAANVNKLIKVCKIISNNFYKLNIMDCFKEVHDSNMSKACFSEEDAIISVNKYNADRYKNVKYKSDKNNKYFIIYDADTSKILKSYKFTKPNIAKYINKEIV